MQRARSALQVERQTRHGTKPGINKKQNEQVNLRRLGADLQQLDLLPLKQLRHHSMRHSGIVHIIDQGLHFEMLVFGDMTS